MKIIQFNFVLIICMLLFTACPPESILGCMNNLACNYNSDATEDDGSCQIPLENPIEFIFVQENVSGSVGEDIISHIHIRNSSCDMINDLVVRRMNTNEAEPYFCFNGICFPTETHTSPNPLSLMPFEEDDYFKAYLNSDISGNYGVKYRFYLESDPTVYQEITISYTVNL